MQVSEKLRERIRHWSASELTAAFALRDSSVADEALALLTSLGIKKVGDSDAFWTLQGTPIAFNRAIEDGREIFEFAIAREEFEMLDEEVLQLNECEYASVLVSTHAISASGVGQSRLFRQISGFQKLSPRSPLGSLDGFISKLSSETTEAQSASRLALDDSLSKLNLGEAQQLASLLAPSALSAAEDLLIRAIWDLGAESCTLYVRDTRQENAFRLVLTPGIRFPETLSSYRGGCASLDAKPEPSFVSDIATVTPHPSSPSFSLVDLPDDRRKAILRELAKKNALFGDFQEREGVRSYACLPGLDGDAPILFLFVNFSRPQEFSEKVRSYLCELRNKLVAQYLDMSLECDRPGSLALFSKLAEPIQMGDGERPNSVNELLHRFLRKAMNATGLSPETGFATIHRHDPRKGGVLDLVAEVGRIDDHDGTRTQSVACGEGVISWVALKGRALLIEDFSCEEIAKLHKRVRHASQSELAIPIFFRGQSIGVLNLESDDPHHFSDAHLEMLSPAANQLAIAWRLLIEEQDRRNLDRVNAFLTELFQNPAMRGTRKAYQQWTNIAQESLSANKTYLWLAKQSPDTAQPPMFELFGESPLPSQIPPSPSAGGWTEYVWKTKQAICLTDVKSKNEFRAVFWDKRHGWQPTPHDTSVKCPEAVQLSEVSADFLCEVCIPLVSGSTCFGVVWMKYNQAATPIRSIDKWHAGGAAVAMHIAGGDPLRGQVRGQVYVPVVEESKMFAIEPQLFTVANIMAPNGVI